MADDYVTCEVQGLDVFEKAMEALNEKVQTKGLRAALKAGASVIKEVMYFTAPHDTGFLAAHFSITYRLIRGVFAGNAYIGPQGKMDYPAFLSGAYKIRRFKNKIKKVGRVAVATVARFLEFGTGKMAKKPFMTAAAENSKARVIDAITASLQQTIERN